jgi:hypothetical protein
VSGPILKDKLFFLGGYEGLRSVIGNIFVFPMPTTASLANAPNPAGGTFGPAGDTTNSMVDAIKALQAAGVTPSQVSLNLLGCTAGAAPTCTGGLIFNPPSGTTTGYSSTFPNVNRNDNGIGKMDYAINSKHRISGMFWTGYYAAFGQDHPTVNPLWGSGIFIRSLSTVENWIWTPSSTVVNEFRFGYDRLTQGFTVGDGNIIPDGSTLGTACTASGCGGKGYPLNTGVTIGGGLPNITINGFGGGLGNPNGTRPGITGPSPYFDFQDSVSYLRGAHALKFGVEVTHIQADQITTDFRGVDVNFKGGQASQAFPALGTSTALEDFFAGTPNVGSVTVGNGNRTMKWMHYAVFVQDDWRIKPRLMLNLGLRYEYNQPMREVNNLLGNFDPNSSTGIVQQGQSGVGPSLWKPDYKNFSPRVGFAWDVTGKGTTVVRGGTSVMYTTLFARAFMDNGPPNNSLGNIAEDPSGACNKTVLVGQTCTSVGGQTFGGTINLAQATFLPTSGLGWNSGVVFPQGQLSCTATAPCPLYALDPNLTTPFVVNYSLGVQHSFTSNLSLDVGYVGNHGYNLLAMSDVNQCAPMLYTGADPTQNPCTLGISRPFNAKFPYLQIINEQTNHAHSIYNGLQATLTQRTSHGLDFTLGYTYSHGLDNGSLNFQGLPPQNSQNQGAEYASSDFDVRHRLTVTASYAIPGKKGYAQVLEGWKLNTIVTVQSAQPWLVFDGSHDYSTSGSGLGDLTDRWDFFGNPSDFRSGANSIPFCSGFSIVGGTAAPSGYITGGTTSAAGATCNTTSGIYATSTPASNSLAAMCASKAADPNTIAGNTAANIPAGGCFVSGGSVMTPNAFGQFGNMGRNMFRDSGFKNVDFSIFKTFTFKERFGAEFRWEIFNIFNHPIFANPYGSSNTSFLGADPSKANGTAFGCGCSTPDVAAGNPLIGSGSSRVMQLGLKLTF